MRHRLVAAEARESYRLWVRFDDGLEGEVDLSDVAGKGVFRRWTADPAEFACVTVDAESGAPTWPGGLDVAPDAIRQELSASGVAAPHGPEQRG